MRAIFVHNAKKDITKRSRYANSAGLIVQAARVQNLTAQPVLMAIIFINHIGHQLMFVTDAIINAKHVSNIQTALLAKMVIIFLIIGAIIAQITVVRAAAIRLAPVAMILTH